MEKNLIRLVRRKSKPESWEDRKPRVLPAVRKALAALGKDDRSGITPSDYLREVESEPAESREQYLIYAAEGLSKALAHIRKGLDPKDFAEATKALR